MNVTGWFDLAVYSPLENISQPLRSAGMTSAPHPPIIIGALLIHTTSSASLGLSPDSQASYSRPTIVLVNPEDSAGREYAGPSRRRALLTQLTTEVVVVDMLGESDHASVMSTACWHRTAVVVLAHGAAALRGYWRCRGDAHITLRSACTATGRAFSLKLQPAGTHRCYFTTLDLFMGFPVTTC
jgi:hypothetical protein